jgi:hypothetical protein
MDYRKITKESNNVTLNDIERGYGKKVAQALVKYCSLKKLDIDDVVGDLTEDGNGMTPWDKFDTWAKNTQGIDIMDNFDDTYDWSGAEEREKADREREEEEKRERADAEKGLRQMRKNQKDLKKLRRGLRRKAKKGKRFGQVYQNPTDFSTMDEASGSNPEDEYFISNWIGKELSDCEWAMDVDYAESPIILTTSAGTFKVTVEPV